DLQSRHDRHPFQQGFGVLAPMSLDNTHHNFTAFGLFLPRRLEHGVRLPNARRHPEKNLELAASGLCFVALHLRQKCVPIGPLHFSHWSILLLCRVISTFPSSYTNGQCDHDQEFSERQRIVCTLEFIRRRPYRVPKLLERRPDASRKTIIAPPI